MRAAVNVIVIVALAILVLVVVAGVFIIYTSSFKRGAQTQANAAECDKYCSLEQQWWAQTTESVHYNSKWCVAGCWKTASCLILYQGEEYELRCEGNDAKITVDCSNVDCSQYNTQCNPKTNSQRICRAIPYYETCYFQEFPSSVEYCKCCCFVSSCAGTT